MLRHWGSVSVTGYGKGPCIPFFELTACQFLFRCQSCFPCCCIGIGEYGAAFGFCSGNVQFSISAICNADCNGTDIIHIIGYPVSMAAFSYLINIGLSSIGKAVLNLSKAQRLAVSAGCICRHAGHCRHRCTLCVTGQFKRPCISCLKFAAA